MKIKSIKVFEDAKEYERARIPGVVCTTKGTIAAYCELRCSDSDWAVIDIGVKISRDGGKSFSARQILVSGEGRHTVNNPLMISSADVLYFFYCIDYGRVFFMKSYDEGETWCTPREITDEIKKSLGDFSFTCIATGPTHGICTRDGTLIVPIWMSYNEADPSSHHPSVIALLYSLDGGESFFAGKTDDSLADASEFCVAELSDGRILVNIRHEGEERCRATAFADKGFSLCGISLCHSLPDPVCCGGMCSMGDGVLFCNCADQSSRRGLTLRRISSDGEILESLVISEAAGYCDVAVAPDERTALVIFEKNKQLYLCIIEL